MENIKVFIGSKTGLNPTQINQRIDIQLDLESELTHSNISFRHIEIQPPNNLNRTISKKEQNAIDRAHDLGFSIGFEFPHIWNGLDIDPCIPGSIKNMIEIARIANGIGVRYMHTNPGDIFGDIFNIERHEKAKNAHINVFDEIKKIHPRIAIENSNPIRHLSNSESTYGFFGIMPEDLLLFNFITLDIAHAQFVVNHFDSQKKIQPIRVLSQILNRTHLNLIDFIDILSDKIQVVHVANSSGLGDLDKEGLKMKDGDADCREIITGLIQNRLTPLILISEPSPYPYEIDYTSLGGIMRDEQVEIFNICTNFYN